MAEAIGLAVVGSSIGGTTLFGTVTAATVTGSVILAGASIGLNYLVQSQMQKNQGKREAQQAVLNQSMAARRRIYGRAMVGGNRFFWDARYGMLYQGILLAGHQIDGIAEYIIGDAMVTTSSGEGGGDVLTYPMINVVHFEPHLGTPGQLASPMLLDRYPDLWTPAHRLSGLAYVVVVFAGVPQKEQQKIFPQGANTTLRFTVRGARIWDVSIVGMDPNNPGTWVWSENPASIMVDYLRHQDGMRLSLDKIDIASFQDMHALCAQPVTRKDGSVEARYRGWCVYELDEEPVAVLARMAACCDGILYQGPSGKIGIRGGRWVSPLVHIPTANILQGELTQGNDKLDAYNRLRVSYTEPDAYYQATEITAREDASSQAAIGVIDQTADLVSVPSWSQAARLAKIKMARDNPIWKGTFTTDMAGLKALAEPTIQLTFDPLASGDDPVMNAPCIVDSLAINLDSGTCEIGFRSMPASAFDWTPAAEEPPKPATPGSITQYLELPAPTSLTASAFARTVSNIDVTVVSYQWNPATETNEPVYTPIAETVEGYYLSASWPSPPRADLRFDLEYTLIGSGSWQGIAAADGATSAQIGPVARASAYALRVRHRSGGGNTSDWTNSATVTIP